MIICYVQCCVSILQMKKLRLSEVIYMICYMYKIKELVGNCAGV